MADSDPLRRTYQRRMQRSERLVRRLLARWGKLPMPPAQQPPTTDDGTAQPGMR